MMNVSRNKRNGKRQKRSERKAQHLRIRNLIIFSDGEKTEKFYIMGLKESMSADQRRKLHIDFQFDRTPNLVDSCLRYAEKSVTYAELWIILDRDEVSHFNEILRYAEQNHVHAAWSNPCIEIWFEAYFQEMHSYIDSQHCIASFRKLFFKRTKHEYEKANEKNYDLLKNYGDEILAIQRAKQKYQFYLQSGKPAVPSDMNPCTTMYMLLESIKYNT